MTVKFNVISKVNPREQGAPKKFYAIVKNNATLELRDLAEQISTRSTVNTIDTIAVLEGLLQVIPEQLKLGNQVRLGDLGSIRLSISSEGSEKEEDVSATNIKRSKVLFRPGSIIKDVLQALKFTKR